jgi:hypothetical protein
MVFVGHLLQDDVLSCSSANDCLLWHATNNEQSMFWKVKLENQNSCNEEGSYLYYNWIRGIWVRSGKTTGKHRQIMVRHLEHRDTSKLKELKDVSSNFSQSYPGRCATYSNSTRLFFLFFFFFTNLMCTTVLNWPIDCIKKLKKWNLRGVGSDDIQEKQRHMASYHFELGYDLCKSPSDNVSLAPGFESIIG